MKKLVGITFFLILAALPIRAEVDNELYYWSFVTVNKKFENDLRLQFVTSQRFADSLDNFTTNLVRTGLGYNLPGKYKNFSIWSGYDWFSYYSSDFEQENRLWQQIWHVKDINKWRISNRTRLEERIFEHQGMITRLRHQLRADYRMQEKLRLILGAEMFVNLNSNESINEVLDQNRAMIGVGYDFNKNYSLELFYMLQHNNRDDDSLGHTFVSNVVFNL